MSYGGPSPAARALPLLGRDEEIAAIHRLVQKVREGFGGVCLFKGEAGIGKTRLIDAAAESLSDISIYRGVAEELYVDRPFGVVADALRLRDEPSSSPRAALWRWIKGDGEAELATADLRFLISEELTTVIEGESLDTPVLLVLEDVHWADPSSIAAVARLARQIDRRRIGIVCTYRPAPRNEALAAFVEGRLAKGDVEIVLRPLTAQDVQALTTAVIGGKPGPNLLRHVDGASGNPLFLLELLTAIPPGDLVSAPADDVVDVTRTTSPPSVHLAVLRRLRFLGEETLQALSVAAVVGESFSLDAVAATTGTAPLECFSKLRPAIDAGFVVEAADRLKFRHDVVREALYADLPLGVQRSLHLQVARSLAATKHEVSDVAHHFSLGAARGDEQAITWLWRAAREATPRSPSVAVNLFERVLGLLPSVDSRRTEVLTELLRPLLLIGDTEKIVPVAESVLVSDSGWETESIARSALYGHYLLHDRLPEAIDQVDAVLNRTDLPPFQKAHFLALGLSRALLGDVESAIDMAQSAIQLGNDSGSVYAVASARLTLAAIALARGDVASVAEDARSALEAMRAERRAEPVRAGTPAMDRANVAFFSAGLLVAADDLDTARERYSSARMGFEEIGATAFVVWAHWGMASLHFHAADWDDALAEMEATSLLGPQRSGRPRPVLGDPLPEILLRRGDVDGAEQAVRAAGTTPPVSIGGWWVVRAQGLITEAKGDPASAAAELERVWETNVKLGLSPDLRTFPTQLARLSHHVEDPKVVANLREVAVDTTRRAEGIPSLVAAALLCTGLIDDDRRLLERAVEMARAATRPILLAECLEALATNVATTDRDSAVRLLREASAIYDARDASRDIARVVGKLRALGVHRGARGPRSRPKTGWESLTPAENQVIELLAEGLSNPQIGDRLFISRRTVATHVSNAFRKLEVSSRVELAALAARRPSES